MRDGDEVGDVDERRDRVVPVRGPVDEPLLQPHRRDGAEEAAVDRRRAGDVDAEAEPVGGGAVALLERGADPARHGVRQQDHAERRPRDEELGDRHRAATPTRRRRRRAVVLLPGRGRLVALELLGHGYRRSRIAWVRNRL